MYPQIYLGHIPATARERHVLRGRALDLQAVLRAAREPEPTFLLLNFSAGDRPAERDVELLLLRPAAVIVGAVREYPGPIEVMPGGRWLLRNSGEPIRERNDRAPLQWIKEQRDSVRDRLNARAARLIDGPAQAQPFERMIGALICAPSTHPDSRISLDVDEHRQLLKILGLDELPGLAAMARLGVRLHEDGLQAIASDIFAGRLWHDGTRFLFDLAQCPFRLRLLGGDSTLALMEGENVVGRRRTALRHENRLTLSGDDLISTDHAQILCEDSDRVILRDTSKNGTWITLPGQPEERIQDAERAIAPGTLLRMGLTRMRLERVGHQLPVQAGSLPSALR